MPNGARWGIPQASTGFQTGEYVGAILLVTPILFESGVVTQYGDKDAVTSNITVCYHPSQSSRNGEPLANVRIFNVVIVNTLRNAIGQTLGGRIVMGKGQGGNTKYTLDEVSDENSIAYLDRYWDEHCKTFNIDPATGQVADNSAAMAERQKKIDAEEQESRAMLERQANPAPPPPPSNGTTYEDHRDAPRETSPVGAGSHMPPPPPPPSGEPPF